MMLDSGGIGRRLDVRINPIRFQWHGVMVSSTLIRSRAEAQFDRTPGDRNFIHIACKSQSIHCVELNPYPLRRNDRDRRCRSEARRMEHSLVCERSVGSNPSVTIGDVASTLRGRLLQKCRC